MKAIVLYHSTSGTTKTLAKKISQNLNCPILAVEPVKPYGSYLPAVIRAGREILQRKVAAVATSIPDLSEYDTIMVGCPVWFSAPPIFFLDFLSRCELKDKLVIPFFTYGGSGKESAFSRIDAVCADSVVVYPYGQGKFHRDDYNKWIGNILNRE